MEIALNSYYSTNGMALALTILRFPDDYKSRPSIRTKALRYAFSHRAKHRLTNRDIDSISRIGVEMFEEFRQTNNLECMRETADIMTTFTGLNNLLDRLRVMEEQPAHPQPNQQKELPKSVYSDSQNVHNSKINQTVIKTLENLFRKYQHLIILTQIDGKNTDNKEKFDHKIQILNDIRGIFTSKYPDKKDIINISINYIKTSTAIFGTLELGMIDAFIALWFWITEHEHQTDLEKRLLEEFQEMNGLCTTGHIARLMNVMQGFTNDETLSIRISDKDQCFAVIKQYLSKELQECDDEQVLEQMITGGEKYVKFIRKIIAKKLLSWQEEYGKDILTVVAETVNDFAKTTVFEIKK